VPLLYTRPAPLFVRPGEKSLARLATECLKPWRAAVGIRSHPIAQAFATKVEGVVARLMAFQQDNAFDG
jgi:hypothetical protein